MRYVMCIFAALFLGACFGTGDVDGVDPEVDRSSTALEEEGVAPEAGESILWDHTHRVYMDSDDTTLRYGIGYIKLGSTWVKTSSMYICSGGVTLAKIPNTELDSDMDALYLYGNSLNNSIQVAWDAYYGCSANERTWGWNYDWDMETYTFGREGVDNIWTGPNDDHLYGGGQTGDACNATSGWDLCYDCYYTANCDN